MIAGTKPREYYRDAYGYHPIFGLSSFVDADEIKDTMIDWGTGAGQVSAADVPIADAGTRFTGTEVEAALQELAGSGRTTETVKANADAIALINSVPTGATMMWWTATPPTGWLICDGSSLLIADYAALSAVIRGTFGGADGTHFYLPNFKGISPTGVGAQDINARTKTGPDLGVVREDQMQGHYHANLASIFNTSAGAKSDPGAGASFGTFANNPIGSPITDGTNGTPRSNYAYTHGPEIGVHFIIKT
jgi:hypothetical protein